MRKLKPFLITYFLFFISYLYRKALPATTGAAGVGIAEIKSFTVQTVGEVKRSIDEVEKTFQVGHHFHTIVLEYLVHGFSLVVEVKLVAQPGAATAYHTYSYKIRRILADTGLVHQLHYFVLCFIADINRIC